MGGAGGGAGPPRPEVGTVSSSRTSPEDIGRSCLSMAGSLAGGSAISVSWRVLP